MTEKKFDFNGLPAHVWPRNAVRDEDGVVSIAGCALPDLAAEYGTNLMVVDEDDFRSRCRDMAEAFGGGEYVHYASKAFLTSRIVRWVKEEGLHLDVASHGELRVALHAGFPASDITAHGNNKSDAYLDLVINSGVGCLVLDSHQELADASRVAGELGKVQNVMVRVKPGVDAHTHEFIATSHEDQKFGFSLASGSAFEAAQKAIADENLSLIGLHCHVGSQVFDAEGFSLAAERVLGLWEKILEETDAGEEFSTLDLGGGYGIAYTEDEQPLDVKAVAADLLKRVRYHASLLRLDPPRVTVEPGRAIAGPTTVTVYTVGNVKDVHVTDDSLRRYIAVDGGISDNIRPMLYEAEYDFRVVNRKVHGKEVDSRVVGSHCESGDILINDRKLPNDIAVGDLVATPATGAYCYSMSSRYNMMMRPAVVSVKDGKASLMVRRETIEDYLALEAGD